ncbi:competence protein ComK [Pullulanibacillus pueri]|uniref:Competence protein ComK n=2 Tax=Pullulanibacillus pueri TaxID=1437324 RepID=A0A8J3A395_9BACL|nr:competence protein ComK [Pullulanibacillus pueri]GGH88681.1 hypothetical protein GCM10007096_41570 [Pullulanibacillus pueri]
MALFPSLGEFGHRQTVVLEEERIIVVREKPLDIIKHSCEFFSASYEGRKKGTKRLMKITHMPPIVISNSQMIIFFPLSSPENADCIWLAHNHVKDWDKIKGSHKNHKTLVIFSNLQTYPLSMQSSTFDLKVCRGSRLKHIMEESEEQAAHHPDHFSKVYEIGLYAEPKHLEEILLKEDGFYKLISSL